MGGTGGTLLKMLANKSTVIYKSKKSIPGLRLRLSLVVVLAAFCGKCMEQKLMRFFTGQQSLWTWS